ncbi:PREDICTED: myeloid cell surface antigen CD33-like [Mandrillus leucophaeus]|uniref:myeloid cell surface antigen CD33-like n=1 Tax=Mandrillus leucophaeus TaxID=9568 RepID=UPI0005F570E3|nr:PREDICTED: myeloid cell surface antigen CD33-like [Mandrillus leucophaeus]
MKPDIHDRPLLKLMGKVDADHGAEDRALEGPGHRLGPRRAGRTSGQGPRTQLPPSTSTSASSFLSHSQHSQGIALSQAGRCASFAAAAVFAAEQVSGSGWEILAASAGVRDGAGGTVCLCDLLLLLSTEGLDKSTPARGHWFKGGTDTNMSALVGQFQLTGDPHYHSCSLVIRDVQMEDTAVYSFQVKRGSFVRYNFMNTFFLELTALTQKPDVYIPKALEHGKPVTVICVFNWVFEECLTPSFSWMGEALSSQGTGTTTSHFSVLNLTLRPQDHDTYHNCCIDFSRTGVSAWWTIQLCVVYASRYLVISISHDNAATELASSHISSKKSGPMKDVVLAATREGAVKTLLLCICFIFLSVSFYSRKVVRAAVGVEASNTVTG